VKFFIIGDQETVLGFRMAGIEGIAVRTPEETSQALDGIFQREGIGVILIPERIAQPVRTQVDRYFYKTTFPLIIEIPDRFGPLPGRRDIRELIRAAVGVQI